MKGADKICYHIFNFKSACQSNNILNMFAKSRWINDKVTMLKVKIRFHGRTGYMLIYVLLDIKSAEYNALDADSCWKKLLYVT